MIKIVDLAKTDSDVKKALGKLRKIAWERKLGRDVLHGRFLPTHPLSLFIDIIPKNQKYKVHRRMIKTFIKYKGKVENHLLAACIQPTIGSERSRLIKRKLRKKDYEAKREEFNKKIKNRLRTFNRLLKPRGFLVKFNSHLCQLIYQK